jgi:L-arabinokinase
VASSSSGAALLAVYVSGHGFGHATRTAEVLRAVRERAPDLPIVVSTTAPAFLFAGVVAPPLELRQVAGDVGLVQKDALVIDEQGTVEAWRLFVSDWDARVAAEARWLRQSGARLVLGDIPPLAFAAAAAAGLPGVGLGNFSWDWIYRHLGRRVPALNAAADWAAEAYRRADLLLRLPFAGDLSVFRHVQDIPLVARQARVGRSAARRRLGLDGVVVLLSFGGAGWPGLRLTTLGRLTQYLFLVTGATGGGDLPSNARRLEGAELAAAGLEYPDLVAAADVVVTKPGYGIVTDCIGARTRLVYTGRGDFPEYPILAEQMGQYLPAAFASNEEIREGRLETALATVLGRRFPDPPRMDGAALAAEALLGRL